MTENTGTSIANHGIAILDSGIDLHQPDLNIYKNITFVKGDTTADDKCGHGTAVAGIAAAKSDSNHGIAGTAPGARLWDVKISEPDQITHNCISSKSAILAGIDYVDKNAHEIDVVNLSYGCQCISDTSIAEAIHKTVADGITFVVAAGNSHIDAGSFFPANDPDVMTVSAMADSDGKCGGFDRKDMMFEGYGIISFEHDDTFASFSNYGNSVSIAAPGVNLYTTYLNHTYTKMSGTSVCSSSCFWRQASLYKSTHPTASPSDIRTALINLASMPKLPCDGHGHGGYWAAKW